MENPPSRLIIQNIEVENFKSYYGKHNLGPFHPYFSCVVGPNGSGKSNVIDALLFVFGFRARDIRMKSIEELIHNSENYSDLQYASVTVHFALAYETNDGTDVQVVPQSSFTVSRGITKRQKGATSTYHLDGRECSLKQIVAKLGEYGLDVKNNRFLILQGEVESISLMKPKGNAQTGEVGLLEYIEEIIGTNQYIEPIQESEKEADVLQESLQTDIFSMKVVEAEKRQLEGPKNEAEMYLAKQRELLELKAERCFYYKDQAEETVRQEEIRLQECKERFDAENAKLKETKKKQNELTESLRTENSKLKSIDEQLDKDEEELNQKKKKNSELTKEIEKLAKQTTKAEKELVKMKEELQTDQRNLDVVATSVEKLKESQAQKNKELEESEKALATLREQLAAKTQKEVAEMSQLQKVKQKAESELTKLKGDQNKVRSSLQSKKMRLEEAQEETAKNTATVTEITKKMEDLEVTLKARNEEREERKQHKRRMEDELRTLENDRVAIRNQLNEVKEKINEYQQIRQQQESEDSVINALQHEMQSGRLKGIFGRLNSLGRIPHKYLEALNAAGGGSLRHIVVDTSKTATQCISFLKKNHLGVETFMIMEKLAPQTRNGIDAVNAEHEKWLSERQTPENMPFPKEAQLLFKLIEPDEPQFQVPFYFAVRNTLVTANMDLATSIAFPSGKPRRRVVTLDGGLIELVGTMSGGGRRPQEGNQKGGQRPDTLVKISSGVGLVDPKALKQMEREFQDNQRLAGNLEHQLNEIQDRTNRIYNEQRETGLNTQNDQQELERKKIERALNELRKQLQVAQTRMTATQATVGNEKVLKTEVAKLEEQEEQARQKTEVKEKEVSSIQARMDAIMELIEKQGGAEVSNLKSDINSLRSLVASENSKLNTDSAKLQQLRRQVTALTKNIDKGTEQIRQSKERQEQLDAEKEQNLQDGAVVLERYQTNQKLKEEVEELIGTLQKELAEVKDMRFQIEKDVAVIESELSELQDVVNQNKMKVGQWEDELRKLSEVKLGPDEIPFTPNLTLSVKALRSLTISDVEESIAQLTQALASIQVDFGAIIRFKEKERELDEKMAKVNETREQHRLAKDKCDELKGKRFQEFMAGFGVISLRLKEMYQMLTLGGDAEIELVDQADPFSEGLIFSVRPPTKSWKNIRNLSGGEKTLSSLSLVFALHHFRPNPLYVMDEIDAALDFRNVSIIAQYIKSQTRNAQFIIISLRNNMFELGDQLIGIYKTYNCTQSVSIRPRDFVIKGAVTLDKPVPRVDQIEAPTPL
ncbi:putative Structural maintenance of chromosomes protein 4 [Blattamonas nauphoetae]|uniref:Structural maintenance of chromosomes protein n=1 Tax=Blattamonas nauphoetae TaxID=2049346 RepID=A0ABQ9XT58_9EUKA|nr:putative Structural maintenance of chromosomes protein 4 [Blattamonas nauphoetae]